MNNGDGLDTVNDNNYNMKNTSSTHQSCASTVYESNPGFIWCSPEFIWRSHTSVQEYVGNTVVPKSPT